jgi:hypothetical protein
MFRTDTKCPKIVSVICFERPPIYLCPENGRFEASKIENPCLEIVDLRLGMLDLGLGIVDFRVWAKLCACCIVACTQF